MKRFLLIILILLLVASSALADQTFLDLNTFNLLFNYAAAMTKSGNVITEKNITGTLGEVNDVYQVSLTSNCLIQITTPHIDNYTGKLSDINGIILFYVPDGKADSSMNFIYGMGEIALATGAIQSTDDIIPFLTELGVTDVLNQKDVSINKTINGLKYSYSNSSVIGFMFTVSKP